MWEVRSHVLRLAASQALVYSDRRSSCREQGLQRDGHRPAGPARRHECCYLRALAFVLGAARAHVGAMASGPHCRLTEVLEPGALPACGCVQRLLRVARVTCRHVGDDACAPVLKPEGRLNVLLLRSGNRVDPLGEAARPPAERVDEVASLT